MLSKEELERVRAAAPRPGHTTSRFAPKLTQHQRHQAYALLRLGYSQNVVAKTFAVARATIGHMNRESSPYYRDVRDNWKAMGEELFLSKYMDMPLIDRANEYRELVKQEDVISGPDRMNPLADKKKGVYVEHGKRFEVFWYEGNADLAIPACWSITVPGEYDAIEGEIQCKTSSEAHRKGCEMAKEGYLAMYPDA